MPRPVPPLLPYPLSLLLGRIASEWESRERIFDLPARKFFRPDPATDLTTVMAGKRVATPAGPAAGPHTQLAQNIVLGWLAGARTFELKTVQILDELQIDRPCIDMETIGYNVEWSQELPLAQSRDEYVKAAMLLEVMKRWQPLRAVLGPAGDHLFELSVGYDLAGIRSERMSQFIADLLNTETVVARLRPQISGPFESLRDLDFPRRLIGSATLSTFHGCPPDEIAAIVRHLMVEHGLDVTVKLNPTLLGYSAVEEMLHDRLGYRDLRLVKEAFAEDLDFDAALQLIASLDRFARERGRSFGIKLTNTLVVENHKLRLPAERMYLSGPPLHVLAVALLDRLVRAMPGTFHLGGCEAAVPVAFSAGIDKDNFAATVGLGLAPVTVCTDLLQPGGYGRLAPMLRRLAGAMQQEGCQNLADWRRRRHEEAQAAGSRDAVEAYAAHLAQTATDGPYAQKVHAKGPRKLDQKLQIWDCTSCHLCVSVCPNDAFLRLATPPQPAGRWRSKWQYLCLAELCNSCGNCETFCPENGDPSRVKPRLFVHPERFAQEKDAAFLILRAADPQDAPFDVIATEPGRELAADLSALINGPSGLPLRPEDLALRAEGDT